MSQQVKSSQREIKVIDAHQHAFWHGRDAAGLVADLDEQGIDLAWILTWEIALDDDVSLFHEALNPVNARPDGSHAGILLYDQIRARDQYPDRFILGYCPSPLLGNAPKLFEAAHRMYNVRICGEWKYRMLIDDPRCVDLFRKAGELKCPVVLHLDVPWLIEPKTGKPTYQSIWYGGTVANLERALKACPDTIFIGHAPGFWREISGDAESDPALYPLGPVTPGGRLYALFDENPNLYADLSAGSALFMLKRDPQLSKELICRFADRILFARDYYGHDLQDFLQSLDLPQDVQDKLYHLNAKKLVDPEEALAPPTHESVSLRIS